MTHRHILAPLAGILLAAGIAFAQEQSITFPIAELGGCNSKAECKTYCDAPENNERCLTFAEANGLMSKEETEQARKFVDQTGPGGCRGNECRSYCSDPAHREECIAFARLHGLDVPRGPSPEEMEQRFREQTDFHPDTNEPNINEEKALRVIAEQGGPGGCKTKDECEAYCEVPEHVDQCLAFAALHELMAPEELERARKMMSEGGPGGCRGRECEAYCENPDHAEECLAFAEEQGFMPKEEIERARKMMNAVGPGGCRGIECKRACEDPAFRKECFEFAVQNGLIPPEEAARMREMMERGPEIFGDEMRGQFEGPGGCQGPEECRAYCEEHEEECQEFGGPRGEGFGPPEDGDGRGFGPFHEVGQERAIEMRGFQIPPGAPCKSPEECREYFEKNPEARTAPMGPMRNFEMPRDLPCKSREECQKYFEENPGARTPPMGPMRNFEAPSDLPCKTPEECRSFFEQNPDAKRPPMMDRPPFPGGMQPGMEGQFRGEGGMYGPADGMYPPPGEYRPPEGTPPSHDGTYLPPGEFHPPEGSMEQPPQEFQPPPESFAPPPEPAGEPAAMLPTSPFVAAVFSLVAGLFGF